MDLKVLPVGSLECNCYILKKNKNVLVIDPGDEYEKIKACIGDAHVLGVLITHHHFDHVGALEDIVKHYQTNIYDISNLEEKEYNLGDFKFEVIYTPGHKEDAITFYFKEDNLMFTGDFLFYDTIGRCDLAGGDLNEMMNSIKKIKNYDKNIIVKPGHGISTTLEREFNYNPFFK